MEVYPPTVNVQILSDLYVHNPPVEDIFISIDLEQKTYI